MGVSGAGDRRPMYRKIWDEHVVKSRPDGSDLIFIDRKLLYEASSYQAFEGLRRSGRQVRHAEGILAVADHTVPTHSRAPEALRPEVRHQIEALERNCREHGITNITLDDQRHGIVHVMGPEQGLALPGTIVVCADSHTSTHGAFGALAFGVGATEFEHILATGTTAMTISPTMLLELHGALPAGTVAKDLVLAAIGYIGAAGAVGHALEFSGSAILALPMEGRMTVCNMAVEAGARVGMIAPDALTFEWLKGRPMAPKGAHWDAAVAAWQTLPSTPDADFDRRDRLDVSRLAPQVTWGTSPEHVIGVDGRVPDPAAAPNAAKGAAWRRALEYMDLKPGTRMEDVPVQKVFIGSCTNSRISDLRAAAAMVRGRRVAEGVHAIVAPGSGLVRAAAEAEGLDRILTEAGFEWRHAGCSLCFGNAYDVVGEGQRCASTSNRNFENRQGRGSRTHLVSPAMAAAAAIAGRFVDIRGL
jgi:3-isopropylmalate/(R)-2-methylmalate dehydratase large subunit